MASRLRPILAAGYGSSIDKEPMVSFAIGVLGTIVSLSFVAVDGRNKFLVTRGEDMLRAVESSLMPQVTAGSTDFQKPKGILTQYFAKRISSEGFFRSLIKGKHRIHMRLVQIVFRPAPSH